MIHFQREAIAALRLHDSMALDAMLREHYQELTLNKDRVKLKPRWGAYAAMDEEDALIVLTARDGEQLVGYNFFFVNRHMHYEDLVVAVNDVFYIDPAYRRGSTPLRFLRFTEQYLRDFRGVDKVAYHFKAGNNFGPILKRLGYSPEEGVAAKLF